MSPLAPYVPGSRDERCFSVDGHTFHLRRAPTYRELGFVGIGRDGDYAPDDDPRFPVLDRLSAGIPGIARGFGPSYAVETAAAADQVEHALLVAARGYVAIFRSAERDAAIARALFALPIEPARARSIYVSSGDSVTVDFSLTGAATVRSGSNGDPPSDFVVLSLRALGVEVTPPATGVRSPQATFPRAVLEAFLECTLAQFGAGDVRVSDSF